MNRLSAILAAAAAVAVPSAGSAQPAAAELCATVPPAADGTATTGNLESGPLVFTNGWASSGKTTFSHLIKGAPGRVQLTLETCSSAAGGETVAIYPATAAGQRMPRRPRVMFSIAVPRGNMRSAAMTIPASGTAHIAIVIENASGRLHQGAYRLTIAR
jgi:hypothetical protein